MTPKISYPHFEIIHDPKKKEWDLWINTDEDTAFYIIAKQELVSLMALAESIKHAPIIVRREP